METPDLTIIVVYLPQETRPWRVIVGDKVISFGFVTSARDYIEEIMRATIMEKNE